MKVLHIVRQYLPSVGGMEEVVRNLVHHQHHDAGCEPRIATLNRVFRGQDQLLSSREVIEGVSVHRLAYVGSERYPICPQILSDVHHADLIHVHGIDFFFDYLALTCFLHNKPMLASTHGGFFHSNFAARLKALYFQTVTRASAMAYQRVVCTSENDGHLFRKVVSPHHLRVIENGVDIEKFHNTASTQLLPRMLYFGRWSVNKGLVETLDLLAALVSQYPEIPWHLTIAGREYDLNRNALQIHAGLRGISDCITIVANPSNQILRMHMAKNSYFICQSRHEGFGIAPIEAMSAGLIPLLSDIPPFRRLIEACREGLLLTTSRATLQAQQIHQLHQRHALRQGIATAYTMDTHSQINHRPLITPPNVSARDVCCAASKSYAWTNVVKRYRQEYEEILELA